jgi:hypothetical protein
VRTDELVSLLANHAEPVAAREGLRRLVLALVPACLAAIALTALLLGINPSLVQDASRPMFWAKELFCLLLTLAGLSAALRSGRPGRSMGGVAIAIAAPLGAMWLLAGAVLLSAPAGGRGTLIMGQTALVCPLLIALISAPAFIAFVWLLRGLAPTRLRRSGAAAGFAAGALGALVYSLHCPEYAAPFLGLWYVLGMLLPTLLGAWAGPRWLRW